MAALGSLIFSFHFYTLYASMELSVWSLPIFFPFMNLFFFFPTTCVLRFLSHFSSNLFQTWVAYWNRNMFIRWIHFGIGRSKFKVTERRNRKKLRWTSQFLCHFLSNATQSWLVHSHWVVNYYKTCSGPKVKETKRCSDCKFYFRFVHLIVSFLFLIISFWNFKREFRSCCIPTKFETNLSRNKRKSVFKCEEGVLLSVYFLLDFFTRYGSMDKERQL